MDPLAGKRDAINSGELDNLSWPDDGTGCPVEVGQVIKLRSCSIEITRTKRTSSAGRFTWVAWFARYFPQGKPYLLDRRGGYTHEMSGAVGERGSKDPTTLDVINQDDRSEAHKALGEPPEPEAVPPHEVAELPTTVAARARFEEQRIEETARRLRRSLVEEVRESRLRPDEVERVRELLAEFQAERAIAA